MHVTPNELRVLRQHGIVIRFALLESMAFAVAELPATGSSGTLVEEPCTKPHWGFVLEGDVTFVTNEARQKLAPGSAFHVPAGSSPHHFEARGSARMAGFEPIDPVMDTTDAGLAALGFEIVGDDHGGSASVIPAGGSHTVEPKQIEARTWPMSSFVLTRARFGAGSGYLNDWCDAPHWGLVTAGRFAIEWEDDLEIVAAGDVYHCRGGPPGHRLEAADPAALVDLTPVAAFGGDIRLAPWRQLVEPMPSSTAAREPIAVAGLG